MVCLTYLSVTVGEQVLSPVLPSASEDLGFSESRAGIAFGLLAGTIAVANLVGGAVLGRLGPKRLMILALSTTTAGSIVAAVAPSFEVLLAAQILLGAGAGLYFPAGLRAVPLVAGTGRRGFAMGLYGVAFSAGLTIAALLGTVGSHLGWQSAFAASAVLGAAGVIGTIFLQLDAERIRTPFRFTRQAVVGLPTYIGAIGSICQYGAIPYLTIFAVTEWDLRPGAAAGVLAIGRVISIVAKIVSGAGMDRVGPIVSARRIGLLLTLTGVAWVWMPANIITYTTAAVFAGTVSSLFPIANVVAVDQFGSHGPSLGVYRSTQIGVGALVGALVGVIGAVIGIRFTLTVAVGCPVLLLMLRDRHLRRDEPALTSALSA